MQERVRWNARTGSRPSLSITKSKNGFAGMQERVRANPLNPITGEDLFLENQLKKLY